tara:strand:- start:388 stop:714 length:327 start_codon:yes stop_codon:yes gene_type:complete
MERYFYFAESAVETTGEACLFPLSSFLGMTPASAGSTTLHFKSRNGAATDDVVTIAHIGSTPKVFMAEVVKYLQGNHRNPFLAVVEGTGNGSADVTGIATLTNVTTEE